MNRIVKRMAVPVGAAIILGSSGFAFMASNGVLPSSLGEGQGSISGFEVSDISYYTSGGDLTYVNFYADPYAAHTSSSDPANAEITFDGNNWYTCERNAGMAGLDRSKDPEAHFTCDLRGKGVPATVNAIRVVVSH